MQTSHAHTKITVRRPVIVGDRIAEWIIGKVQLVQFDDRDGGFLTAN